MKFLVGCGQTGFIEVHTKKSLYSILKYVIITSYVHGEYAFMCFIWNTHVVHSSVSVA